MRKILTFILLTVSLTLSAQQSCDEIKQIVESKGSLQASYCCFNSSFLTGVKFYSYYQDYSTIYFALAQFNYGKWYIYQVPGSSAFNFSLDAYGDQAGEAFHKYIHAYRKSLGCAPNL